MAGLANAKQALTTHLLSDEERNDSIESSSEHPITFHGAAPQQGEQHHRHGVHIALDDVAPNKELESLGGLGFVAAAPRHLRTPERRWICLGIMCIVCCIISGPIGSWPTIEPLLIEAGIYAAGGPDSQRMNLNAIFSIATVGQLVASLPFGWLYDRIGGRPLSLWGGIGASVGLGLMSVACYRPQDLSWLMYIGYPTAQIFGQVSTYGIFTYIWLLPNHQNLVSGATGGVQYLSFIIALAAVALSAYCHVFIGAFLSVLAGISFIGGFLCFLLTPTKETMLEFAAAALGGRMVEDDDSQDDDSARAGCMCFFSGLCQPIWRSLCAMKEFKLANALILVFSTAYLLALNLPIQQMLFFYQALFGIDSPLPQRLVDVWSLVFGIGGFVLALAGGAMCDKLGVRNFVVMVAACTALMGVLLPIKTFETQLAAEFFMTVGLSLYNVIVNRFAMLYAAPDIFGTFGGVLFTVISLGMYFGFQGITALMELSPDVKGTLKYEIPYAILCSLSTLLSLILAVYWYCVPPPAVGAVWAKDKEARGSPCAVVVN